MEPGQLTQIVQPDDVEEPLEPIATFDWSYLQGIPKHVLELNQEFNSKWELKPIKLFITGPPAAGKTHFAKQLGEHFNIEVI
jgi:hypothetical protein